MIKKIFVKGINKSWMDGMTRYVIIKMLNICPVSDSINELRVGHVITDIEISRLLNCDKWEVEIT